jgi:hypothetical protein
LIVRDEIAKSFRTIALDLNNNLDEEKEALKIFKDAFLLVGTE